MCSALWSSLKYQLRLAIVSLRRDRQLTIAVFVCLALGSGMWTMVLAHYILENPPVPALPPGLHHVELDHPRALALDPGVQRRGWHARTRVTFPELMLLAGSGIPTRQTATFRSALLVAPGPSPQVPAQLTQVRFVNADFFPLFLRATGAGRPFSASEDAQGAAVAVVGLRFAERLGLGVGQSLVVEGRPFQIVGLLAADQPTRPEWDIVCTGRDQDAVYVPFGWGRRFDAAPDQAALQSSPSRAPGAFWESDAVFATYWAELPDAAHRDAYAQYLARTLGAKGIGYQLRSFTAWRALVNETAGDIFFFVIVIGVGLVSIGFTISRLMLAKAVARHVDLGIHRALGATRAALFRGQMLEAALIVLPAAVAGIGSAAAQLLFFNHVVHQSDVPVPLTAGVVLLGAGTASVVGLLAAAYPSWRMARTRPTVYLGRV